MSNLDDENLSQKINSLEARLERKREQFLNNNYYTQFQNIKDYDFQPNYIKIESVEGNKQPVYYTTSLNPSYSKSVNLSMMSPSNEYFIRKIVKEEFATLILPYQHDLFNNINQLENQIYDVKVTANLNKNSTLINKKDDDLKKFFENINFNDFVMKAEYDNKITELTRQISFLNLSLNNLSSNQNQKEDNLDNKISTNKINLNDKNDNENIEDGEFKIMINNLESRILNLQNNFQEQIDNLAKEISKYINDSKIIFINNEFNKLKDEFTKIKDDLINLKYQFKQYEQIPISKINNLDYEELKKIPYYVKDLEYIKKRMNTYNNQINQSEIQSLSEKGLNNSLAEKMIKDTKDLSERLDIIEQKILNNNNNENNDIKIDNNNLYNLDNNLKNKINSIDSKILEIDKKINQIQSPLNNENNLENNNLIQIKELTSQLEKKINLLPTKEEYNELKNLTNENSNYFENIRTGKVFPFKSDFDNLKKDYEDLKKKLSLRKNSRNNSLRNSLLSNRSLQNNLNKNISKKNSMIKSLDNKNDSDNREDDDAFNLNEEDYDNVKSLISDKVWKNYSYIYKHWKGKMFLADFGDKVNDWYLKTFGQKGGTSSYEDTDTDVDPETGKVVYLSNYQSIYFKIYSNAPFVVMSTKPKKKNSLMTSFAQFVASVKTCSSKSTNC